jgi:lipase chaperone LimK
MAELRVALEVEPSARKYSPSRLIGSSGEQKTDRLQFGRDAEAWKSRFDEYAAGFEPVLGRQERPPDRFNLP